MTEQGPRGRFFGDLDALRRAAGGPTVQVISRSTQVPEGTLRSWFPTNSKKWRTVPRNDDQLITVVQYFFRRTNQLTSSASLDGRTREEWLQRRNAALSETRVAPLSNSVPGQAAGDRRPSRDPRLLVAAGVLSVVVVVLLTFVVLHWDRSSTSGSGTPTSRNGVTSGSDADVPFTWETVFSEKIAGFMFPQSVSELGPSPQISSVVAFQRWARKRQGIAAHVMGNDQGTVTANEGVQLGLSVRSPGTVVILTGMDIEVLERLPAMDGTHAAMSDVGGDLSGRRIEMDADTNPPTLIKSSSGVTNPDNNRSEPLQFPYRISSSDPELFYVWVRTVQHIKWRITIQWLADGHSGEAVIDDHGKPFEVAMPAATAAQCVTTLAPSSWKAASGSHC